MERFRERTAHFCAFARKQETVFDDDTDSPPSVLLLVTILCAFARRQETVFDDFDSLFFLLVPYTIHFVGVNINVNLSCSFNNMTEVNYNAWC